MFRPDLYQALHTGNDGDIAFYLSRCQAKNTLELGCGAGRISIEIAKTGAQIIGIDEHTGMIDIAKQKANEAGVRDKCTWMEADMEEFDLKKRFERIIIPYSTFYCLPDLSAKRECLKSISRHLTLSGELWFDGYLMPSNEDYEFEGNTEYEDLMEIEVNGQKVKVQEMDQHDQDEQRCMIHYRFLFEDGSMHKEKIHHHYIYPDQIKDLLKQCGLKARYIWADFQGNPLKEDSERMIVCAKLAQ